MPDTLTPMRRRAGSLDGLLRRQLAGCRVGFYVPARGLGGSGDLASAWHLSRALARLDARVTIFTDASELEALERWPGDGVPGATSIHLDGGRGPLPCPTLESGGVAWAAATPAVMRGSFGRAGLDLLVAVHDAPRSPEAVSCPTVLVHEYGDHETRVGGRFRRARTLEYRTGFLAESDQLGDVTGGIYLSREFAERRDPAWDYFAHLTRDAAVARLIKGLGVHTDEPVGPDLSRVLAESESISVCYAGHRSGAEDFIVQWCRARAQTPSPVLIVIRRDRLRVLEAVESSRFDCRVLAVEPDGNVALLRDGSGRATGGCLVLLESGVVPADFPVILALANDVSLLTGDHSITEALAVASARAGGGAAILPIPFVGWYEKAEDYAQFLAAFDARLAAAYLGWVLPRVDGTRTRTARGKARSQRIIGAEPPPGAEYLFAPPAVEALRAATRSFLPWLLESRAATVSGRDAAFIPQSFPRAVAHLLCGHNIDDLRVA